MHIDPTYLRYIYDGLIKGSIHSDNSSELPEGLIGLYEEVFEEHLPVLERQQLLQRFALFALLKKEVSAVFVAEVLGESETDILEFINVYTSWFNSPEPGKFQLYHERLKVFVLQKLSEYEIMQLHDTLTSKLNSALAEKTENDLAVHAYEYFAQYLVINSQLFNDYNSLDIYVNSKIIWENQIKASKGFTWTHKDISLGLKESARRKDEFVTIRSITNSIIIDSREQNSAEEVLNILREGDIQLALQRAERWSGPRLLNLYLLILNDLTIGECKGNKNRRDSCVALMNSMKTESDRLTIHQNEEMSFPFIEPLSIPLTMVYQYFSELETMQVEGMLLFEEGDLDLCQALKHFLGEPDRLQHLFRISLKNEEQLPELISEITLHFEFLDQKEFLINQLIQLLNDCESDYYKCLSYSELIKLLVKVKMNDLAGQILEKSLITAEKIEPFSARDDRKKRAYNSIVDAALSLNQFDLAITFANCSENWVKAYNTICSKLIQVGEIQRSVDFANSLDEDSTTYNPRSKAIGSISITLMETGQSKGSLSFACKVHDPTARYDTYLELANITWAKQDLSLCEKIIKILDQQQMPTNKEEIFSRSYKTALMFFNIGNHTRASEYCFNALKLAYILRSYQKRTHLENLCVLLVKLGFYEEAFSLIDEHELGSDFIYPEIFRHLSKDLGTQEVMENLNEIAISRNEPFISNQIIELLAERSSFNLVRQLMIESLKKPGKIVLKMPNIDSPQQEDLGSLPDNEIEGIDFDLDFLEEFDRIHKEIMNEMSFQLTLSEFEAELTSLELNKNNIDHVVELCSRIQNDHDRIKGYLTLCDLMLNGGLIKEVEDVLEKKVKNSIPPSYISFLFDETNRLYSRLYLKKEDFNNALKKINEIKDLSTKLDALFEIRLFIIGLKPEVLEEKVEQIITSIIIQLLEWLDESIATKQFLDVVKRMPQDEYLKNRRSDFFNFSSNIQNELHRSFACKELAISLYLENEKILFKQVVDLIKLNQVKEETYEEICIHALSCDLTIESLEFVSGIIEETNLTNTFKILAETFGLETLLRFYNKYFSPLREFEFVQGITTYFDELQTDISDEFPILYHFTEHSQLQMSYLRYKARQFYLNSKTTNDEYTELFNEVFDIES